MDVSKHKHKKVVLFNGPPGSGKDTATVMAHNFLDNQFPDNGLVMCRSMMLKFADPLKAAAHALYGIPYSCEYYEREFGNKWKNEGQIEFFGCPPRDEYIALSETYAKVRHGTQVFGHVAARRVALEKVSNVFLFSDSGFVEEVIPLIDLVGVDNLHVVEIDRPGCSFAGDSRTYISKQLGNMYDGKVKCYRIPNYGDKMDFRLMVRGTMSKIFKVPME